MIANEISIQQGNNIEKIPTKEYLYGYKIIPIKIIKNEILSILELTLERETNIKYFCNSEIEFLKKELNKFYFKVFIEKDTFIIFDENDKTIKTEERFDGNMLNLIIKIFCEQVFLNYELKLNGVGTLVLKFINHSKNTPIKIEFHGNFEIIKPFNNSFIVDEFLEVKFQFIPLKIGLQKFYIKINGRELSPKCINVIE